MAVAERAKWWTLLAVIACLVVFGTLVTANKRVPVNPEKRPASIVEGNVVVVAKDDIPEGTLFDPLIEQGGVATTMVPSNMGERATVTDVSQLELRYASRPIYAGEQIPLNSVCDLRVAAKWVHEIGDMSYRVSLLGPPPCHHVSEAREGGLSGGFLPATVKAWVAAHPERS